MRKAASALLAVPVLASILVGSVVRRSISRLAIALVLAVALGAGVVLVNQPTETVATAPTPIVPLTRAAFQVTVSTDHSLSDPVSIEFSTPMNRASVDAALTVEPPTDVALSWDASGTTLTVAPRTTWSPGTFHTVTVEAGALAGSGQPLAKPARAVFMTRPATSTELAATDLVGDRVGLATAFRITFAGPVDDASVRAGLRFQPALDGELVRGTTTDGRTRYTFVPDGELRPDAAYRLTVVGLRDPDGLAIAPVSLGVRTVKAPAVVRFRPRTDTLDVGRDATISVRFTESMDRASTTKAFRVMVDGRKLTGKVRWAEQDTVLVFTSSKLLPYGRKVVVEVGTTATSAGGVALEEPGRGIFRTVRTAAAVPVTTAESSGNGGSSGGGSSGGGGSAVGGGSWAAVETYYLDLMNCTRTGGWVTSGGSCSSPGGRDVAALKLDAGISSKVSRPYAKRLAVGNDCSHFIGGSPGDRLRRAGYTSYRWAENIGCRSGNPYDAVLGSHLFFQSEKPYNGGHYRNLMNAAYDRVGIGVWVYGGRVRLVVDFYHP